MKTRKKLSTGQISALKRKAGKKAAKNPGNNPVQAQTVRVPTPRSSLFQ